MSSYLGYVTGVVMTSISKLGSSKDREKMLKDTVVELREERHENVVYSITMKKDGSLQRNASLNKSFTDEDSMKEKNTSRHMKGATLEFMVDRLAEVFSGENEDVNFLNVFLTTYRTFATPKELFEKLQCKYLDEYKSETKDIRTLKSIMRVFRAWLERYLVDDFQESGSSKLLEELLDLAKMHDDVTNENDAGSLLGNKHANTASPIQIRKNGLTRGVCFTDFVAAKLAVARKASQTPRDPESPQVSPSRLQNPNLNVSESSTINSSPAKAMLNELTSTHVATQLTVIAAKLFHRVQPHHCLATVSSPKAGRPHTVRATINQFNKVVYCVIGTVLCPCLKLSQRTKMLTKWIEVAQECRELKNFSSLRAIVSGLQTHALHRLKRAWAGVPPPHTNLLTELAEMNMKDVLMKVGTAKVNTEDSAITRVRKEANIRREQDMHSGIMHGTVPYLGSFLTDLTYLDTARPNYLEGGLINFEKRRKEFELLAQLQLWQASCRSYQSLSPNDEFVEWFESVVVLSEEQSITLSKLIEHPTSPLHPLSPSRKTLSDMIHVEMERNLSGSEKSKKGENGPAGKENHFSQSCNGRIGSAASPNDKISSDERRAAVIKKALVTFGLDVDENLKSFSLVQLLQDKEIKIPDTANVFYAMSSTGQEPTLLLLEEGAVIPQRTKRHQSTPNKPKKTRHRKNVSLTYSQEPESGRASPSVGNAVSPMKSLINQLTFSSVALVGGSSYSMSNASSRRSSENGSEIAGSDDVILTNSRTGIDLVDLDEEVEPGPPDAGDKNRRSSRCHSADFANSGVILPIRVVRSSRALSSTDLNSPLTKSAPSSPEFNQRQYAGDPGSQDILTATGRLIEWPRYSASATGAIVGRSSTWSSRRAIRRPKKVRHSSTFYVSAQDSYQQENSPEYINHQTRPSTLFSRSASSHTLPGRFTPDFSGHDYDNDASIPGACRALSGQKTTSFASVSNAETRASTHAFTPSASEDVFAHNGSSTTREETSSDSDSSSQLQLSPVSPALPPLIKVQSPSPRTVTDDSDFFVRYNPAPEAGFHNEGYKNTEDVETIL